jgi:hypothetical protein
MSKLRSRPNLSGAASAAWIFAACAGRCGDLLGGEVARPVDCDGGLSRATFRVDYQRGLHFLWRVTLPSCLLTRNMTRGAQRKSKRASRLRTGR